MQLPLPASSEQHALIFPDVLIALAGALTPYSKSMCCALNVVVDMVIGVLKDAAAGNPVQGITDIQG